ncbi:MAG TPA: FliG C-terminal domain-containing protein [Elusimicrobiales bacterium]|nr:FliG C-terminal domain-containing protein [Elusimicrobiales bacterium]
MERQRTGPLSAVPALFLLLAVSSAFPGALGGAETMDVSLLGKQDSLRRETETKIKNEILDPIMGPGKSYVFADVELEIIARKAEQTREGLGIIQKYKEKPGNNSSGNTDFLLPGVPKPKSVNSGETRRPEAAQGQQAEQGKGVQEVRWGVQTEINRFQVNIIYDETVSSAAVSLARERVGEFLVPYKIKGKDEPTVLFKPTKFKNYNMLDDLRRPSVYLPLLYAALLLLFLFFLFGPLWGFFRKYVQALMSKPGAEVNIDQKTEEGEGAGGGKGGAEEGRQQIDMNFQQKEPEKEEDEDELMKKFEPFAYVTEDNLKRLIYLFLLRKEDPWVVATVLSYLKPELARQALSMLSVEMQAKVALESLTVRQATREQIDAIDRDLRENIDFVTGGIERLSKMLEDSDPATRKNIIEYLKAQKPDIYEKVKRTILMFEDIGDFPDRDMQTIIRGLSNEDVAKALSKADPKIVNKFYSNMSEGAARNIKEIIDLSGAVSPDQVEAAQTKILSTIKGLEMEGKINVRQQGTQEVYIIDGAEMSMDARRRQKFQGLPEGGGGQGPAGGAGGGSPAEAGQYLAAGADLYNQGRYEESLPYLEYAAGLNASDPAVHQYLGGAYYALGRAQDAVRAYENYARLSKDPAVAAWLENFKQQVK